MSNSIRRERVLRLASGMLDRLPITQQSCERCAEDAGLYTISFLDRAMICFACKIDEMTTPGAAAAETLFWQAIDDGRLEYGGPGMSVADREHLSARYKARMKVQGRMVN